MNNSDPQFNNLRLSRQGSISIGYTLTLTVNASLSLNNTSMSCRFEATGIRHQIEFTKSALLFVVTGEYSKSVSLQ